MSAILDHSWGVSPAVDRIWCQVSGLAPSRSAERLFMVLQAFVDDSYKDGVFVLGGHIARAEDWASFSRDWEQLLPYGVRDRNGSFHFKMSEMALTTERMERVAAFYRILEEHVPISLSCIILRDDLENALTRVAPIDRIGGIDKRKTIFSFAFRFLIDTFHLSREELGQFLKPTDKVDFYFDEQAEKREIIATWDEYLLSRDSSIRDIYGATPRFENDKEFLPLQAADLWAWWVRKWYQDGNFEGKITECDFGLWKGKSNRRISVHVAVNEDEIAGAIRRPVYLPRPYIINYSFK